MKQATTAALALQAALGPGYQLVLEDNQLRFFLRNDDKDVTADVDVVQLVQAGAQPDADYAEAIEETLDEAGVRSYKKWC